MWASKNERPVLKQIHRRFKETFGEVSLALHADGSVAFNAACECDCDCDCDCHCDETNSLVAGAPEATSADSRRSGVSDF